MLWEPVTPWVAAAASTAPVAEKPSQALAKSTLVELVPSPCKGLSKRTQSDTELGTAVAYDAMWQTAPQQVLSLNACVEAPTPVECPQAMHHRQRGAEQQRFLDLNVLIDDRRCQRTFSSDTCQMRSDTPNALSDASTDTPREPIEDINIYEVLDASLIADIMPADPTAVPGYKHSLPPPGMPPASAHISNNDGWQYLQPGHGCVSAQEHYPCHSLPMINQGMPPQLPLTCHAVSGQVWQPQWQWTSPQMSTMPVMNSIAPQFSTTDALRAPQGPCLLQH
jgi:hypothetical protein